MKLVKQLAFSLIILISLSSFGLINNSMLLQKNTLSQSKVDSLGNEFKSKRLSEKNVIEQTNSQQKEINKREQDEEKSAFTLFNKVAYVILLGIKSILTLVVKLFML